MRIEPVSNPFQQIVEGGLKKPPLPSYDSILVSSHAPTWPQLLTHFLGWIWGKVRFLFSWYILKKKEVPEEPPKPAPEIIQAVQKAKVEQQANKSPLPDLLKQTAFTAGISWLTGKEFVFVAFVANKTVSASAHVLEKIAQFAFPEIAPHWKKVGSLAIAAPVVWKIADDLGYPLGSLFLVGIAFNGFGITMQAFAAANQQREMRLRQLTS